MLYFGCSQWHYGFWNDTIYKGKISSKHHLHYYSKAFNCVELNSTYYQHIDINTLLKWKSAVSSGFKFCPKFPKVISHDKMLSDVEDSTDSFIESVLTLKENLGISYLQLPPNFNAANILLLDEFLSFVNNRISVSVEIRPDWLARADVLTECLSVLKKHKAGIVMVDGADTVKYLNHLKLTNKTAFIRFLSYDHPTDFERINDWVRLIKLWQSKGLKEIYFMLHFADGESEPPIVKYARDRFLDLMNEHKKSVI